jgi:hypothetical protein
MPRQTPISLVSCVRVLYPSGWERPLRSTFLVNALVESWWSGTTYLIQVALMHDGFLSPRISSRVIVGFGWCELTDRRGDCLVRKRGLT